MSICCLLVVAVVVLMMSFIPFCSTLVSKYLPTSKRLLSSSVITRINRRHLDNNRCMLSTRIAVTYGSNTDFDMIYKPVKRKVAMVISFVGSNYYGLQMDPKLPLDTIELKLAQALHSIGCISDSNNMKLPHIQWVRSSRTDKGVHAAKLLISAKLEIREVWYNDGQRLDEIVRRVNLILPEDIRVISCIKVNQGFRSRDACHWREYEYVLPASMLTMNPTKDSSSVQSDHIIVNNNIEYYSSVSQSLPTDTKSALEKFNRVLSKFPGAHSFHNFHRLGRKGLGLAPISSTASDDDVEEEYVEDEEVNNDEIKVVDDTNAIVASNVRRYPLGTYDIYDTQEWNPIKRILVPKTRGVIYNCEAQLFTMSHNNEDHEFIKVRVRGQAFLLHQIRIMIGSAVLATRGTMPECSIDYSLLSDNQVLFPLAPAQGLILMNAGFAYNSNKQPYALTNDSRGHDDEIVIISDRELENHDRFLNDHIYKKVFSDWIENDIMVSWVNETSMRFNIPNKLAELWANSTTILLKNNEIDESNKLILEYHRIKREIDKFPFLTAKQPHKKYLPNTIMTVFAVRFNLVPGKLLIDTLRSLATAVVQGTISYQMTPTEYADYVTSTGGIQAWSRKFKDDMIE